MSLNDWLKNDWLKAHSTTTKEVDGLLAIVDRELRDSEVDRVSADGRFSHAYRAALTLATVPAICVRLRACSRTIASLSDDRSHSRGSRPRRKG